MDKTNQWPKTARDRSSNELIIFTPLQLRIGGLAVEENNYKEVDEKSSKRILKLLMAIYSVYDNVSGSDRSLDDRIHSANQTHGQRGIISRSLSNKRMQAQQHFYSFLQLILDLPLTPRLFPHKQLFTPPPPFFPSIYHKPSNQCLLSISAKCIHRCTKTQQEPQ